MALGWFKRKYSCDNRYVNRANLILKPKIKLPNHSTVQMAPSNNFQPANNPHSQQNAYPEVDGEVSLKNIFEFLMKSWKTLTIMMFLGLLASGIYIAVTPKQYEAIAQMKMAQISLINPTNPFGVTVEDPASLIARMRFPTNYDQAVIDACSFQDASDPAVALSKSIELSVPKGISNTVEIKVFASSPEKATSCAVAIVDLVARLQAAFAKPFIEEAKQRLLQDNQRIDAARRLINNADASNNIISAAYLAARDEIIYFLTDREKMTDLINSAEQRGAKLVSPIYASPKAILPKKRDALFTGLLCGLILGLILALGVHFWQKRLRNSNSSSV